MTECERLVQKGFIDKDFLLEEVRNDYVISIDQKKCWAIQLDILRLIIGLCKKSWFGNGKKCLFEDTDFIIPENSDAMLRQFYGEYMELPPIDKRKPKHRIQFLTNDE